MKYPLALTLIFILSFSDGVLSHPANMWVAVKNTIYGFDLKDGLNLKALSEMKSWGESGKSFATREECEENMLTWRDYYLNKEGYSLKTVGGHLMYLLENEHGDIIRVKCTPASR